MHEVNGDAAAQGSRRPVALALALSLTFLAAALAGCLGGDAASVQGNDPADDWDGPVIRIPVGAFDPGHNGEWYLPSSTILTSPASILIINDDLAFHRVLGFWTPESMPEWADDHGGGGHDHDHGASGEHEHDDLGSTAFDIWLDAGESIVVDVAGDGALLLHCHPHPWMEDTLEVQPRVPRDYEVVTHEFIVVGRTSGEVREGQSSARTLNLEAPNLAFIVADLAWDDGEDDVLGLGDQNEPDTLRLTLLAPDNSVAAEQSMTARHGQLRIEYQVWLPPWPQTLRADGAAQARSALAEEYPEQWTGAGTWRFIVAVEDAPGLLPLDGTPGSDGRQTWTLDLEARHVWPGLGPTDTMQHQVTQEVGRSA